MLGVNIVNPLDSAELAEVEQLGAKRVRVFMHPGMLQPQPYGALNPGTVSPYRSFVDRMTCAGIGVDFVVVSSPGTGPVHPAASPGHLADFFNRFAARVRGQGDLLRDLERAGRAAWWLPSPTTPPTPPCSRPPTRRSRASTAARSSSSGRPPATTTSTSRLSTSEGIKGYFDAAAVHTDTACLVAPPGRVLQGERPHRPLLVPRLPRGAGDDARQRRRQADLDDRVRLVVDQRRRRPPATAGMWAGKKPSGVSEAAQAENLTAAVRCMSADPYLKVASWFTMRDAPSQSIDELRHYGLLRSNGTRKPAWNQMYGLLHGTISAAPSNCADLAGPQVVIEKPTAQPALPWSAQAEHPRQRSERPGRHPLLPREHEVHERQQGLDRQQRKAGPHALVRREEAQARQAHDQDRGRRQEGQSDRGPGRRHEAAREEEAQEAQVARTSVVLPGAPREPSTRQQAAVSRRMRRPRPRISVPRRSSGRSRHRPPAGLARRRSQAGPPRERTPPSRRG